MWTCFKFSPMKNIFRKTISRWEFDYDLLTNLPRTIVAYNFSPSEFFQTEKRCPTSLIKIGVLTWELLAISS